MSFFSLLLSAIVIVVIIIIVIRFNETNQFFTDLISKLKFPTLNIQNPFEKTPEQKAVEQLEQTAKDEGFDLKRGLTAKQEKELLTDSGSVVIGSGSQTVNFGLIGDVLPTNPSKEFLENKETLLTPEQLERFNEQQIQIQIENSLNRNTFGKRKRFGV